MLIWTLSFQFVRKSVEVCSLGRLYTKQKRSTICLRHQGLSIYLFIFAFLGNFFYVASILTAPDMHLPEPQAAAFLRESIPCVPFPRQCHE